ncbi:glycosyltransferase [Roseomonas sp. HJA6]|uniref:Glycosyltransferase n=1 Tax=Roseomonas alba TaxID=2846776 RepID=A0ABS7A313_9PROT|nr:glycosyltransferase [Neoroseomonas alba]MBW6396663.1 glycosyltransferase [Neoroseomonas alba]
MNEHADVTGTDCDVVVIIPLYRQPALFSEAIASVLAQQGAPACRIIVVLDGCVYRQSLDSARAWARAHAPQVVVLAQPNRGLAAARNAGIRFALQAWPGCRAMFFLDADNRIGPHFLRRAWQAMSAAAPEVGWIYPDFDLFGIGGAWSTAGTHDLLQHLTENICDAAALVRREVCEAGVVFDESLRAGFEDWDFFLRAASAGFRGAHLPQAGFTYRRRPESMLTEARRDRAALLSTLRSRHRSLYAPRAVLGLEAREAPRFALFEPDAALACLDPEAPPRADAPASLIRRLAAAHRAPGREHAPALAVFAAAGVLPALRRSGLLRGILAHAERLLESAPVCGVTLGASPDGQIGLRPDHQPKVDDAALVVLRSATLAKAAGAGGSLAALPARGMTAWLTGPVPPPGGAVALAQATARGFAAALRDLPPSRIWRPDGRIARAEAAGRVARSALRAWPLLPLAPQTDRRDIAFMTPVFGMGGVERVLCCLAAEMRRAGWRTHLVVTDAETIARPPAEAFDGIVLLPGFDAERHGGGRNAYAGAATSLLPEDSEETEALLGLLAPMQAVLVTHAFAGHALVGRLRRFGIRTACALHLSERGAFGEPIGNPQTALAYQHAYDLFVAHSRELGLWCAASGVPEEAVLTLENAPGYPAGTEGVAAAVAGRRMPREGRRLRALFLGRLDRQKGPDRLAAIMAATRDAVDWRVVGRAVLDEPPALPVDPEPPVEDPAALDALYAWADALVLPSRFEGVPLTVLEAQRMGCVPVATDVGGVAEAVTHGEDGLLVPNGPDGEVIRGMTAALLRLAGDDGLRRALAEAAATRGARRGWDRAAAALLEALAPAEALRPLLSPTPAEAVGA